MPDCYPECGRFIVLKHNLLSQHNIPDWDILLREETKAGSRTPMLVQQINIQLPCGADTIALSAVGAPYLKIAQAFVLNALLWCQPLVPQ